MPGRDDLTEVSVYLFAFKPLTGGHHQLRVTNNTGQNVVEIVGDAACELPQGFHLGGLLELVLQIQAIGFRHPFLSAVT